jgi:hypothetical protein
MEAQQLDPKIRINGKPFLIEGVSEITYEDVIRYAKMPMGVNVICIHTHCRDKKKTLEMRYGASQIIGPGEKIRLAHGLDISAYLVTEV